ncbi:ribulose-phosphate 3-epimerase [Patescibacteria group bacterium]|nr:ribulose-phosphate 3-epimerase [Patescibacteria group bacterium]MBU2579355.1 ribulose-phosphate 3-epimerase [Patescibacteria group bacterium]
MIQVIPAIIAKDFEELKDKIKQIEPFVEWAQLDVMDGKFVDNITWNHPSDLKKLKTNLKLEAHLMVEKPEDVIDSWIKSGVKRIIIHYEATKKLGEVIKKIQDAGLEASIAINPETSANELSPFLNVSSILSVLIMTVRPGRGGQEFIEATLGKIRALRERDENVKIEVDGGINLETAQKVVRAGADILAVGSAIFKSEDIKKSIEELKSCHL